MFHSWNGGSAWAVGSEARVARGNVILSCFGCLTGEYERRSEVREQPCRGGLLVVVVDLIGRDSCIICGDRRGRRSDTSNTLPE